MATRMVWSIKDGKVIADFFEFEWNGGFAISQKLKNVKELHDVIHKKTGELTLEVSTKSSEKIGVNLSAFNLKVDDTYLENVFQSSKKYLSGGPFLDLLDVSPHEAKTDIRHQTSGMFIGFEYKGEDWPTYPCSVFYDFIYLNAMVKTFGTDLDLSKYSWFSDIEFNYERSYNCQARSVTIYKLLQDINGFEVLKDKESFIEFHKKHVVDCNW